jgi:prefoldin subunit 5
MNKERRKALATLHAELDELMGKVGDIRDQIDTIKDEEQEYFDNMHENLQGGERGQAAEAAVDLLQTVYDSLDNATTEISDAMSSLEEAGQEGGPLIECFAARGYQHTGDETRTVLRKELQGQPKFQGLCGPMWGGTDENGDPVIRYEDWASYEVLSR